MIAPWDRRLLLLPLLLAALTGASIAVVGPVAPALLLGLAMAATLVYYRPYLATWAGMSVMVMIPPFLLFAGDRLSAPRAGLMIGLTIVVVGSIRRITVPDVFAAAFVLYSAGFSILVLDSGVPVSFLVDMLLPVTFYFFARFLLPWQRDRQAWPFLVLCAVGSVAVLADLAFGQALLAPSTGYDFDANPGSALFRPAGLFSSPPTAAIVLSMLALASLAVLSPARKTTAAVLCITGVAILATFGRAGWAGAIVGLVVFIALYRPARAAARRYAVPAVAGVVVALALLSFVEIPNNETVELGVIRGSTVESRESLIGLAAPLITDSPEHALFGRGSGTFLAFNVESALPLDPGLAASPFLLERGGPHSSYALLLLEVGIVGFLLWGAWGLTTVLRGISVARRTETQLYPAALTAALTVFFVASLFHDAVIAVQAYGLAAFIGGLLVNESLVSENGASNDAT